MKASSLIHKITTPPLVGMIGVALFAGWCIGFVAFHAKAEKLVDENNIVLGRDFMAFYLSGRIIYEDNGADLYEPLVQQNTQDAILVHEKLEGLSYYINPASVAVAYSVLARLPYRWAFYSHTLFMLACLFAGILLLRPHLASLSLHWLVMGFLTACWLPMMHTITGGQNAALCFLLLSVAYAGTVERKQWLAGLALGLLLFKPQYAVPVLGLLLLRKRFVTTCVAAAVGAVQYIWGSLYCGWDWPVKMADKLGGYYRRAEDVANSPTHMSFMEVLDYSIIQPLGGTAGICQIVRLLGYAILGLFVIYLIWIWRHADPARPDFGLYWALVTAATLLLSGHTQYYDGALLILPVLLILGHMHRHEMAVGTNLRLTLIVLYVAYFPLVYVPEKFEWFRFQPVFVVPIWICAWAAMLIKRERARITC